MATKRICVFSGSSTGHDEIFKQEARQLGYLLAYNGMELVCGGGQVGLMGIIAKATLEAGGLVTAVIPRFLLDKEGGNSQVSQQIIVESFDERKAVMHSLADGFIALPGGYGTLDELLEVLTLKQMNRHQKFIGALNINGYFTPLLQMFSNCMQSGFMKQEDHDILVCEKDSALLLEAFDKTFPASRKPSL